MITRSFLMKKLFLLLLLSFNVSAACQVGDSGVNAVIVNDVLGYVAEKNSIFQRVLKKDDYSEYSEYALDNPYSNAIKQLTSLDEKSREIVAEVHLAQSMEVLRAVIQACTEKELKSQLNFLLEDNYAKYRETMQGDNHQVETTLLAVLTDILDNQK